MIITVTISSYYVASLQVVVLVVAVVVAWLWQRQQAKGIFHVRLEENGGTVEMTNPMYLHASSDQEDDPNLVFSLHDSVR